MLSVAAAARRIRAYGGQFVLLAVLTMVATALVGGVPRLVNWHAEQGLRQFLADRPARERDVAYTSGELTAANNGATLVEANQGELATIEARMPASIRPRVERRWYSAYTEPARVTGPDLAAKNLLVDLGLRIVPDIRDAAALVEGRWPAPGPVPAGRPVEVALDQPVAQRLNLRVGSGLTMTATGTAGFGPPPLPVTVVGLFRPHAADDGTWEDLPPLLRVVEPAGDGQPLVAAAVANPTTLDRQAAAGAPLRLSWRYRLGAHGLDVRSVDQVLAGLQEMSRQAEGRSFVQGFDVPLRQFVAGVDAADTVLAVIGSGVLATLAGIVALATMSAVRRRRAEFVLLRARGGATGAAAGRSLVEALLVVPPAAAVGWLAATLMPGRPGDTLLFAVAVTVLLTLALPAATLAVPTGVVARRQVLRLRPSARRLTLDVGVLLLAALAAGLLRRRGLVLGEIDPLLVSVPVLLAAAAGVLAVRLYPLPLRLVSRLAARARGSVAFLGTARAGRAVATAPLVVVVLAIATAAFSTVVAAGVDASRDRAATALVPADAVLRGTRFAPDTRAELERSAGASVVAPLAEERGVRLGRDTDGTDAGIGDATVLLVDAAALDAAADAAGRPVELPGPLLTAPAGGPLPAVVSPAVAADLARAGLSGSATITVQSRRYEFRVAARAADFPLLDDAGDRFVVLPWQAAPTGGAAVAPTGFVLTGTGLDATELSRIGDAGQARFQAGAGRSRLPVEVSTWDRTRRDIGARGPNGMLVFGFVAGAVAGTVLGLLAIAFTVLAGARARGQVLSRLRTLGLSRGQGRGLLLVELTPLVAAAVVTGALVGALLPVLLNPLLGLTAFTGGVPVRVAFEPTLVVAVVVLGAVALGLAITVEALNNRRSRLGEALRLGEES
ncbi:FtsX-like permease family protein [Micromonospora sp. NPDC000089]|uniref:FtsX-like permease family protein n=1 Tax=unclassified Micromonospora TaxID=2617518 RepID=UPI0036C099F5